MAFTGHDDYDLNDFGGRYAKKIFQERERGCGARHPSREAGKAEEWQGGKGGTVKSRKQAIAIGLSEARKEGKKVPRKALRNTKR